MRVRSWSADIRRAQRSILRRVEPNSMWAIASEHDRGRHSNPYKHSNECFLCRVIVVRNTREVLRG